jgi:hypothetical protein
MYNMARKEGPSPVIKTENTAFNFIYSRIIIDTAPPVVQDDLYIQLIINSEAKVLQSANFESPSGEYIPITKCMLFSEVRAPHNLILYNVISQDESQYEMLPWWILPKLYSILTFANRDVDMNKPYFGYFVLAPDMESNTRPRGDALKLSFMEVV